jgi:hypothetical protein
LPDYRAKSTACGQATAARRIPVPMELLAYANHVEDAGRYLTRAREALARAHAEVSRHRA